MDEPDLTEAETSTTDDLVAGPTWDAIVVGGGPAGLVAATTVAQRGLHALVIESKAEPGGQPRWAYPDKRLGDVPGFPDGICAAELARRLFQTAVSAGVRFRVREMVVDLQDTDRLDRGDELKRVVTNRGAHIGRKIVLACGRRHYSLRLPILDRLESRRVHYDMPWIGDFDGADIVVVGGGDAAIDAALMAHARGGTVRLIAREEALTADPGARARLRDVPCRVHTGCEITGAEIDGDRLVVEFDGSDRTRCDRVIVQLGYRSSREVFERFEVDLDEDTGAIAVDPYFETNRPGVFAVGDVNGGVNRIAVAWAEGVLAAINAFPEESAGYWMPERGRAIVVPAAVPPPDPRDEDDDLDFQDDTAT